MNYVLDTSILISIRKGRASAIEQVKRLVSEENAHITLLSFSEYYYGALPANPEGRQDCLDFLSTFSHLSLTKNSAIIYAALTYKYKKKGLTMDPMDMLTASITIDNDMTLITSDEDFNRVEELKKIMIKS